ncbi:MAG: hypothetical protein JNM17_13990 [Archangium sp.]|nr:hypothetical protein [Archangium sp.]
MDTAKLFKSGRSQAVRLPRAYRFDGTEVAVRHFEGGVLLLPLRAGWDVLENSLDAFERGIKLKRDQPGPQRRAPLKR